MNDIWNYLSEAKKPILLYGMGNGADKILDVFEKYGIHISGIFASDGFVRGNIFRGYKIVSFSEIKKIYKDPIIILGFASHRDDVIQMISDIAKEYELYAPDVPVYGNELFSKEFYSAHENDIKSAKDMLYDETSRNIFDEIIRYKLDGKISHLFAAESLKEEVFHDILKVEEISDYADLGAYKGDTIKELLDFGAHLKKIYAFEPDAYSFKKLSQYVNDIPCAEIFNACAYDKKCTLIFGDESNRGSSVKKNVSQTKTKEVPADSLDNVLKGRGVDYIKYDVEGSEYEALIGSTETIRKYKPKLCVSLYHRSEDIYRLIFLVRELCPEYKLYLRRFPSIPAWDLNLYAI